MKRTLFAGAIALTVVSPAFAADLPAAPPPQAPAAYVPVQAPVYNWGGVYIGANAGGSWFSQSNPSLTWSLGGTATGQSVSDSTRAPAEAMSDAEFNKKLQEMIQLPPLPGEEERK